MRQAGTVQTHRERLVAPASWWLAAAGFAAAWGWVALVVAGPPAAIGAAAGVGVVTGALLWVYGATRLEGGPDGLRVGRAHLTPEHLGDVQALAPAACRTLLGPGADARAWLHVRPYIATAVRVEVTDPADPTPYWVVSTRNPERLATALGGSVAPPADPGTDSPTSPHPPAPR